MLAMLLNASPYVVYDTSVWTEAGYALQRYIGAAATVGILMNVPIFGFGVVVGIILHFMGRRK